MMLQSSLLTRYTFITTLPASHTAIGHMSRKGKKINNGRLVCNSRSISSRPSLLFLEALVLRMAAQTPVLTGRHSESLPS